MLLLKREDIEQVFTMEDSIEAVKEAFKLVVEEKIESPLRTNIQAPNHNGVFLFMPAYVEDIDTAALKIINLFPDNIDKGMPSSPAEILLIDGTNGLVTALLDGTYVTQLRTGASSGAAFDVLAKKDCKIGALIGTGGQAATQLEAMLVARDLEEVRVFDLNYERTVEFAEKMKRELDSYGAKIVPVKSSDEAIDDADLLITVTPSPKPVFDGTKIKEGATISCVGSYQHHMQELDPAVLPRVSKIYFDSQGAVLSEAGDILIPLEEGVITEDDFTGNLGDVLNGDLVGRENDKEIILYETVGVAAQDLMTAKRIYDKAKDAGIGMEW